MAFDFIKAALNFVTAGGYSLTTETADAIAGALGGSKASGESSGGTGGPSGYGGGPQIAGDVAPGSLVGLGRGSGSQGVSAPVQPLKCCCWEISGDYLLNGETGQVWLINKEKMELLPLKRSLPPMESAARAMNIVAMKHAILEQKDTEIAKMPYAAREQMTGQVNALIKAFDKEIGK